MMRISLFLFISIFINSVYNSYFRGGMISWEPAVTNDPAVLNTKETIIINQRYTWSKIATASTCTTILSFGLIGETAVSVLTCQSPAATCTSVGYTTDISTFVPCTDYDNILGTSYGYSSTATNLTARSSGFVLGYVVSGAYVTTFR